MACRGILLALSGEQETQLLALRRYRAIVDFLQSIEADWDEDHLQETDKSWDAMHRCLSDGSFRGSAGTYPLNRCVLGGRHLGRFWGRRWSDHVISYVPAAEVKDVAFALPSVTKGWFHDRYWSLTGYDYPKSDLDFEYTWAYFEEVRGFYQKAAREGRAVVFIVDQ